jgi:hypothetical protein
MGALVPASQMLVPVSVAGEELIIDGTDMITLLGWAVRAALIMP